MRKAALQVLCAGLLVLLCVQTFVGQDPKPPVSLKVGDVAPDFKLQYFDGTDLKNVNLSDYHGKKNVVLAFYVFAFTGG